MNMLVEHYILNKYHRRIMWRLHVLCHIVQYRTKHRQLLATPIRYILEFRAPRFWNYNKFGFFFVKKIFELIESLENGILVIHMILTNFFLVLHYCGSMWFCFISVCEIFKCDFHSKYNSSTFMACEQHVFHTEMNCARTVTSSKFNRMILPLI